MTRLLVGLGMGSLSGLAGLGLLLGACSGDTGAAGARAAEGSAGRGDGPRMAQAGSGGAAVVSELRSSVTRVTPAASEAARASNGEQAFAFSFLHALPVNENLTFSPHSLIAAFAMLSDAAAGETLQELERTLHFGTTDEAFHRAHGALKLALSARNREAEQSGIHKADAQVLTESNDIWLRNDAEPAPSYLDTLARYYGAGVHRADFEHAPEEARRAINGKVASDTHGLISELIPSTAIDQDVVAVLTNALYFKAPWATQFAPPRPGDFYLLDGGTSNVNVLSTVMPLPYYAGNGFVSVALPYYGNDLSMLLVVPEAGRYEQVREQLSGDGLSDILAAQTSTSPPSYTRQPWPLTSWVRRRAPRRPSSPAVAAAAWAKSRRSPRWSPSITPSGS